MFKDRDINLSVTTIVSLSMWAAGGILIVLGFPETTSYGQVGLYLAGIGGVLSIRTFIVRLERCQRARERNAFELGHDAATPSPPIATLGPRRN